MEVLIEISYFSLLQVEDIAVFRPLASWVEVEPEKNTGYRRGSKLVSSCVRSTSGRKVVDCATKGDGRQWADLTEAMFPRCFTVMGNFGGVPVEATSTGGS